MAPIIMATSPITKPKLKRENSFQSIASIKEALKIIYLMEPAKKKVMAILMRALSKMEID